MIYAVIDTNVLVSALLTKSENAPTAMVLKSVMNGHVTPLLNKEICAEYLDVLSRSKFHFTPSLVKQQLEAIEKRAVYAGRVKSKEVFPDADDVVFYEEDTFDDCVYFKTAESEGTVYHPTQKPVELGRYLIRTYTNEGDIVLDNACRSGSFIKAAELENRIFIGIKSAKI